MADVAAIVLAAGLGSRFGAAADDSKLLAEFDGAPIVRRVVETALGSRASPVLVVIGHAGGRVSDAVAGLPVRIVRNADYAIGMAASLRAGLAALPIETTGALIALADMPLVESATLDTLITRFGQEDKDALDAVVPVFDGNAGNPVLVARRLFGDIMRLEGDRGARSLFGEPGRRILFHAVDDPGIHIDIDTPERYLSLRGKV